MSKAKMISLETLYKLKKMCFDFLHINTFCEFLEEKTPIRPNHITVLNWFIGLAALYLLFVNHSGFVMLILLNFVLDNLDGYYARSRGLQSKLGECFDHIGDFVLGELFMFKSWLFYGDWWIPTAMALFFIEALIILRMGIAHEKFPTRAFLIFFVFGFYKLGLVVQAIYQPSSFVVYLTAKKVLESNKGKD